MTDSNPGSGHTVPLPASMVQRAREFRGTPAPERPAATVVLLRPEGEAFQLYVVKRAATMVFGGLYAFPGGGVDPSDRPETIRTDWADRLGVPDEQARAVVGAAARELFEEAGVLLAGPVDEPDRTVSDGCLTGVVTHARQPADDEPVSGKTTGKATDRGPISGKTAGEATDRGPVSGETAGGDYRDVSGETARGVSGETGGGDYRGVSGDVSAADWEADRAAVAARALSMTDLLRRRGLRLRDDLLFPWARWITPEFEPRRFDTWFFVALLPEGQTARDVSGESEVATWVRPAAADGLAMLPPTRSIVNAISAYGKMAEVIAAASRRDAATPVMPRVEITEDGSALLHIP